MAAEITYRSIDSDRDFEEIKQLRLALETLLPYAIDDGPGGCTGEYEDCEHCAAIRRARQALARSGEEGK